MDHSYAKGTNMAASACQDEELDSMEGVMHSTSRADSSDETIESAMSKMSLDTVPEELSCLWGNPSNVHEKEIAEMDTNELKWMLENRNRTGDYFLFLYKDRERIKVHKSILSARSSVFRKMIDTREAYYLDNTINVDCVSLKGMQIVLKYMYCGELPVEGSSDWNNWTEAPEEILFMAGNYQLDGLVTFCTVNIGKVCKFENAGELLNICRQFELEQCFETVKHFFEGCFAQRLQVRRN